MVEKPVLAGGLKTKDPFLNLTYIEEVNKRNNKEFGLFENYQINPYTRKTLDFVTLKIVTRPPKLHAKEIPGYCKIKESYWKAIETPKEKYSCPQTEAQRYGWFPSGSTVLTDPDNSDERFKFSHRTADFIKVKAMLKEYDQLFNPHTQAVPIPK